MGGIISLFICLIISIIRTVKRRKGKLSSPNKPILNFLTFVVCAACMLYSYFYICWGFNWYREPIEKYFGFQVHPSEKNELKELCQDLILEINKVRPLVAEDENGVMKINGDLSDLSKRAEIGYINLSKEYDLFSGSYCRPRYLISSEFFCRMNIVGIFIPYTFESNINKLTPDSSKPSTLMHEMAHQRGITNESEANYIAYLASISHDDVDFIYSGYRLALNYCLSELSNNDYDLYAELLSDPKYSIHDGFWNDNRAGNEFWEQYKDSVIKDIATSVNDSYIKSHGDDNGIRSYNEVVSLLLAERRHKLGLG